MCVSECDVMLGQYHICNYNKALGQYHIYDYNKAFQTSNQHYSTS